MRIAVQGAVQGVGFRPTVFRFAREHGCTGWVQNSPAGVTIEVEGPFESLRAFDDALREGKPPRATISHWERWWLDAVGYEDFEIRESSQVGPRSASVLPDMATCADCLADIRDPTGRRYRYPFTNCTNCGPRYSILEALPYDRPNTTMRSFRMCPQCLAEYESPGDRRFHAQPNACPVCGPQLALWRPDGSVAAVRDEALMGAAEALREGQILAAKGIGGFHLMVDAADEEAVGRLRLRKSREHKPLAVMAPSMSSVESLCRVGESERRSLVSPEAPIVLLEKASDVLAPSVAPSNPYLGMMLPYSPMHHLLLAEVARPVVATSGNLSDEPMCIDELEALARLGKVADLFLVHNRPIQRRVDDSIVRTMAGREMVMRRARGFAPLPFDLPVSDEGRSVLAVGAHLKNAVALTQGTRAYVSQHVGDLETAEAAEAFSVAVSDLQRLYEVKPTEAACDLHPDYLSTQRAEGEGLPLLRVQHHYAHVLACMADNALTGPVLGVSWDGTGLGPDKTIWGGEFLRVTDSGWERVGHLRGFRLPGGDAAAREPRRSAIGVLWELGGAALARGANLGLEDQEREALLAMLAAGVNCPWTTSAGRLFDAVSALIDLRSVSRFEGEAAMALEFLLGTRLPAVDPYPLPFVGSALDWGPMVHAIFADLREGQGQRHISARFHRALASGIVEVARQLGEERVLLTGGCFQNRCLLEGTVQQAREAGFRPYWHQRIPPNDGGIALGQAAAALRAPCPGERQPCA